MIAERFYPEPVPYNKPWPNPGDIQPITLPVLPPQITLPKMDDASILLLKEAIKRLDEGKVPEGTRRACQEDRT